MRSKVHHIRTVYSYCFVDFDRMSLLTFEKESNKCTIPKKSSRNRNACYNFVFVNGFDRIWLCCKRSLWCQWSAAKRACVRFIVQSTCTYTIWWWHGERMNHSWFLFLCCCFGGMDWLDGMDFHWGCWLTALHVVLALILCVPQA